MNDRFKFRGIHPVLGELQEIKYIDFIHNTVDFGDGDIFKIEQVNMQQSTGLKDKNGKLIFEGDIVRYAEYEIEEIEPEWKYTEIVWGGSFDYPAFDLKQHNFDNNGLSEIFACGWTIEGIGNIYQNKGLLNA